MIDPQEPIEYRYLNLDTKKFCEDQGELSTQIGKGGLLRAIPAKAFSQVLIAGSRAHFTEAFARYICHKIVNK